MQIGVQSYEDCPFRHDLWACKIAKGEKVGEINGCQVKTDDNGNEIELFPEGCPLLKKDCVVGIVDPFKPHKI